MPRSAALLMPLFIASVYAGCHRTPASTSQLPRPAGSTETGRHGSASPSESPSPILFTDVPAQAGIRWRQVSGTTPDRHFPSANGSGLAMLDFDGDGWLDLYFITSCTLPPQPEADRPHNALYRNARDGTFEDVTSASGLDYGGFGQGVAVGDIDNDGFPDVFLPGYGSSELCQSNGDGTYRRMGERYGIETGRWGVSAAFLDYDEDGNLDLYVANYGHWTIETNEFCGDKEKKVRTYCSPRTYKPELHTLFHNLGDGRFREVTAELGIQRTDGRGQGVVAADINGDQHIDLYVANDLTQNFLFINNGNGGFYDKTMASAAAYDSEGHEQAGMGVDVGDAFGTGRYALF